MACALTKVRAQSRAEERSCGRRDDDLCLQERAEEGGLKGWFRRLFQGVPANAQARAPHAPTAQASAATPQQEPQDGFDASDLYCPELAAHAQALNLVLVEPAQLTEPQRIELEELAAAIVSRCA